jgi:hypothetical protein
VLEERTHRIPGFYCSFGSKRYFFRDSLTTIPERFPVVPGSDPPLSRLKIVGYPKVPPLSIFFTYTDTLVQLQAAEIIDKD